MLFGFTLLGIQCSGKFEVTPEEARYGWAGPEAVEEAAPIVAEMPPFEITDEEGRAVKQDNRLANVRLWKYVLDARGEHLANVPQQVGDCVSWGAANVANYLQYVQISQGKQAVFRPAFPPYIYGTARHQVGKDRLRGDGCVGAWAAKAVTQYGALAADEEGVPAYSGAIARQWGASGPPAQFVDAGSKTLIRATSPIRTAEECRDAICNGYPVTIASNWGGLMKPPTIDGRLVNRRVTTWNHQMCVIGYDGETGSRAYFYVLNSWGAAAHGTPPDNAPPGGFWISAAELESIVKQGDSFAFSNFDGFQSRDLFNVWGKQPDQANARQRKTEMAL